VSRAPQTIDLGACLALEKLLADLPPSMNRSSQWLRAHSKRGASFKSSDATGKWCIPATADDVDEGWGRIKKLLKRGKLLYAKVSTAAGRARSGHENFVIIAYTADWSNRDDVNRVREVLRQAGFAKTLGYKRDLETVYPNEAFEFIYPDF